MFTSHTKIRRWLAILLVLAMMIGLLPAHATPVQAAEPAEEPLGTIDLRPEGITIDLFDYWTTRSAGDPDGGGNMENDSDPRYTSGINKDHHLKFGQGMGQVTTSEKDNADQNASGVETASKQGEINKWTNGARPMAGIVNNTLDDNGYPTLAYTKYASQSLGYLFDSSSGEGKTAYSNVGGLLRQDENGYYYYNSAENFAEFDKEENVFTVYDQAAVTGEGVSAAGGTGMFFPFNTKDQVFSEEGDLPSTADVLNHYFGLHMTTSFQQTTGGVSPSDGETPVTFSFSGDDDVWIFIDDVLVADLGGIHDACAVEIDFQTGGIYVYKDSNKNGAFDEDEPRYNEETATLKSMFTSADREDSVAWSGDTFVDESYHTLDFFYLERGNVDSNMRMKYNLKTVPESDLVKVDQDGDPVAEASFELYETDENYSSANRRLIAEGTTDDSGSMTFRKSNGDILPLSQLDASRRYLLIEDKVPARYRHSSEPIKLYVKTAPKGNKKLLLSYNEWDTGAYAMPKVRVTANTTSVDGDKTVSGYNARESYNVTEGLIIAAVFKGENVSYENPTLADYSIVYGDPLTNWTVGSETGVDGVIEAAEAMAADSAAQGLYAFSLDSSGAYSTDIENLPGDIKKYAWMVADSEEQAEFTGAYFYVEGIRSLEELKASANNLSNDEIHLLDSSEFERDFSVRLLAPNIQNRLLVQKVIDGTSTPVNNAEFKLYEQDDNFINPATGEYTDLENVTPVTVDVTNEGKTGDVTLDGYAETIHGALAFYGIPEGEYYLVETSAPEHLDVNKQAIPVIVDDTGVHVNAGDADDSVSVNLGVGKIVKSMVQFATDDGIDATLHDITATLQSADASASNTTAPTEDAWANVKENDENVSMNLSYSTEEAVLEYGPTTEGGKTLLSYDSGWGRLNITQNDEAVTLENESPKQALDENQSLNNLFSGTVMVTVGDKLKDPGNLSITKNVVNAFGDDITKDFQVKLTHQDGELYGRNVQYLDNGSWTNLTFDSNNEAQLTIKANQTIQLQVPDGVTLAVEEENPGNEYDVSYQLNNGEQEENSVRVTTESGNNNTVTITNTRISGFTTTLNGETSLTVTKKVDGDGWPDDATFSFTINGIVQGDSTATAPMPDQTTVTLNKPTSGNETTGSFGNITFTEAGTYVYTISETSGEDKNISYDQSQYTVTVQVDADQSTGELEIGGVTYTKDGESVYNITFTNTYTAPDEPTTDPDEPTDPDNPDPDTPSLNKDDHFLYIEGYPEDYRTGEYSDNEDLWPVKPQGNITRAEVATIFYRLLKDEVREEIETDVNSFPDVNADDWFNVTVSSLANMNAISGYEDGTFRPNEPITRAELAAMAGRFYEAFDAEYEEGTFRDVDGDEWYADAIAAAAELGILGGYPDGTVRPNNNITRAETCAIVNRVLERRPHDEHLGDVDDMRTWPDNLPGAWYYADMQEATNGHYYEWIDIDGVDFEEWTEVDKDYDWTKR